MPGFRTPICERLGIETPIFGFSHSPDVVVAISDCGGYPVFGVARENPDHIEREIAAIRKRLGSRPFAVDVMYPKLAGEEPDLPSARTKISDQHKAFVDGIRVKYNVPPATRPNFFSSEIRNSVLIRAQTKAVLASDADAIATAVGLPPEVVAAAKARGKSTFALVGSVRHVAAARKAGADFLVAQGYDAGGHTGPIGTFTLSAQVIDAAGDIPVLVAGGVGCGRQIAASLAMGAQGVWLGTAWLAARENHTPPKLLERLLRAGAEDTVLTRAHSGKSCRVVRSAWTDEWAAPAAPDALPMPYQHALTGELLAAIDEHQVEALVYEAAGQSVAWFGQETTVAEIFQRLTAETDAALDRLGDCVARA